MSGLVIALLVLLGLIALVALILSFPLSFYLRYVDEELYLDLKFLFFKKRLMPSQKKQEPKKEAQKPKGEKKPKDAIFDTLQRFGDLLSAGGALGKLALSLHRAELDFKVEVGGEDAAEIAVGVGKMQAYLHTAAAALANLVEVKKRKICVTPDYNSKKSRYDLSARLYSRPIVYLFNIHKILPLLLKIADALPNNKGEKKQ